MIRAVIFDMDGVLINSTKYIWKSFNILLSKFGVNISNKDIKKYLGKSLRDQIKMWKEDFNIKEEIDYTKFSEAAFKTELRLMKNEPESNHEAKKVVEKLKEKGLKIAVATSSQKPRAEKMLSILGIKNKLDTIVTADDVDNHKPNPDIFLKASNNLGVSPEECVVIEDAANGIEAAKKAKMKAIAILTEYHTKEELKEADLIVNSLSEIDYEKIQALNL